MKIVHVEDYFDPSAGYQINELAYASMGYEDDLYIITSNDMSPFHKKVSIEDDIDFENKTGVKIIRLNSRIKISSRLLLIGLGKTLSELAPDLVFMHGIGDFKDFNLIKKKKSYVLVRDCHMSWVASENKYRRLFYNVYKVTFGFLINHTKKYSAVFALGDEEYEYLKNLGIHDHKIQFLRHGYNQNIMKYSEEHRRLIREKYNVNEDEILISYIGKFDKYKQPDKIFEIIKMCNSNFLQKEKIKLLFIGPKDDDYYDEFSRKLEISNLKAKVIVDNYKPFNELYKYYSASDICIFPKQTTLSSIHAQVCGCPVLMEDHKSNYERVVEKSNLYPLSNYEEAARRLEYIVSNRKYYKENNVKIYNTALKEREYQYQVKKIRMLIDK